MAHLVHLPIKLMVLVILVSQRAFPITALSPSPCLQSATRLVALDETYTVAGHESLVISGLYTLRSSNMAMEHRSIIDDFPI